ncbi:hypothetical protein KDN24_06760 [Bacillus sp. Bva_UNVM-123]|uniref:hypothetical protein n=1 Tax=Bacillus sp. Bva_UNVM-123 TaxID=2829798 RepID=UPI00391FC31F
MKISEIYEGVITKKVTEKAKELGIEFKVKHSVKDGLDDVLLRIKRDVPMPEETSEEEFEAYAEVVKKQNLFADFVADIVVGNYANQIRFSYPSKL